MARFKEVELKRQGCVSLVSRMYPDDTLFDYVVYINASGEISDIENGKKKDPRISTLIRIADYFNISLDELIGRKLED